MKKLLSTILFAAATLAANAQGTTKDLADVVMQTPDISTFASALKTAEIGATFKGRGPYTLFIPVNDAFAKLPKGASDKLMDNMFHDSNVKVLTYHVVSKKITAADLMAAISAGGGKAEITTFSGDMLIATTQDGKVKLTDEKGKSAWVVATDWDASNGVIHTIDSVLMPQ